MSAQMEAAALAFTLKSFAHAVEDAADALSPAELSYAIDRIDEGTDTLAELEEEAEQERARWTAIHENRLAQRIVVEMADLGGYDSIEEFAEDWAQA